MNKYIKICVICKKEILTDIERWVRLTDFEGKIKAGEVSYHLDCWKERFKIDTSERKKEMYANTIRKLKGIMNQVGGGNVVTIQ